MENKLYWLYFFNRKIELQIRDSRLDWKQKWWPTWPKNDFSPKGPFTNNVYEILGFLTTYPLGFTLSMVWMLTKSGQFYHHLPTSSCKRSLWMAPKRVKIECLLLWPSLLLLLSFCLNMNLLGGSFNNYMTKYLHIFDHLPPPPSSGHFS